MKVQSSRRWVRRLSAAAGSLVILYVVAWVLTATFGIRDVISVVRGLAPGIELTADPERSGRTDALRTPAPWYFVGNGSAPCPFVVGVDICTSSNIGGSEFVSGRAYYWWCFTVIHERPFSVNYVSFPGH